MDSVRQFIRSRPKTSFVVLIVGLVLLAVVGSWLIDTDREKITRTINRTRQALERGDGRGAVLHTAPDFNQDGITRLDLRRYIQQVFDHLGVPNVLRVRWKDLQITNGSATCEVTVYSDFRHISPDGAQFTKSRWKLTFGTYEGRWYFTRIEPLRINNTPVDGLKELVRRAQRYR